MPINSYTSIWQWGYSNDYMLKTKQKKQKKKTKKP